MIKLNGIEVKPTIFPDGTSQLWKLSKESLQLLSDYHRVDWEFESEAEFMHLAQLKCLLDYRYESSYLFLPYLPYARQDKPVSNEATFALHIFIELLNVLAFDKVSVLDPHSEVANDIRNLDIFDAKLYILSAIDNVYSDVVCFPDSGAFKRYKGYIPGYLETIAAYKIRDQLTGEISEYGFTIPNSEKPLHVFTPDLSQKTVLIVDDLCDAGGTFKLCAEKLYDSGAKEVHLYVTHGLFTKGTKTLRDSGIKRIFTRKGEVNE